MNKERRKAIEKLAAEIQLIQLEDSRAKLSDAKDTLESLRDEEQEYIDNMPENLQGSDKHSNAEEAVRCMEDQMQILDSLVEAIEDFQNNFSLDDAISN